MDEFLLKFRRKLEWIEGNATASAQEIPRKARHVHQFRQRSGMVGPSGGTIVETRVV